MFYLRLLLFPIVCCGFLGCALMKGGNEMTSLDWYRDNERARVLSQLTEEELAKFAGTDLLDVQPVIVPTPENTVGENDYFMWPIATMVEDTMVVLYARSPCHWGPDKGKSGGKGGIRMVVTSSDGGKTWTEPVDVLEAGTWEKTPFYGFGGGLGVHDGVVYLALCKGVYCSKDKGRTWDLVCEEPDFSRVPETTWAPGMRITFDAEHGLTIWTNSGFSQDYEARAKRGEYGTHMVALYSPDFGKTWHHQSQPLPDGLRLSEVTAIPFEGQLAFFLRNGLKNTYFGQGYSPTGWFPFQFACSDVGPVEIIDTPDIQFNPLTKRLEAGAPFRKGNGPGPKGRMKVNLYSIAVDELAAGSTKWRYDGTLIRYRDRFGVSDGFNIVGSVVDTKRNRKVYHVWGGDCTGTAGIFQYSVSLDTPAVAHCLKSFYEDK
jgi:hypothetical protein